MTPEAKRERAAYMREWRRRNPDKQREYEARKWERKAAEAADRELRIKAIQGRAG